MKTSKTILGSLLSIICLLVAQFVSQFLIILLNKCHVIYLVSITLGAILYVVITYYLIQLMVKKYLKINLEKVGISKFKISFKWLIVAVLLPVLVVGIFLIFKGKIVNTGYDMENVIFNILYGSLAAGIVEELVFRGVILNLLSMRWNYLISILVPSIIFASLHIISRNLSLISIIQLMVAGTLVGVMFSLIEMSQHSVWNNAIVHSIWNLITSALFAVSVTPKNDALFTYVVKSKNMLLTGGDFGMESSVIAIIGYIIVILIVYKAGIEAHKFSQDKLG
ncbi:CPBP family intramembrane glutamic endopeptidase [Lactobacillus ultunensis]|uniref:CAAX amino terminal protease family protein n=1 Tax=Lactobacillus ultunensis DSM 16047 TaxID=525365 RepID=C2ENL1_9LACO|nr:type II CAAX endopeptidase family protein [Lactobacillus ultunensis]EEJ71882.1 CAAX amino terminal protease family protein [Lactobacillus ultunensis DSM 16047]KRL79818.1 CAAX amino terminal protease [Lactobacillus ultunensis DSM 16047]QQP27593.1 CPBP family intramembrane metalloprotease [Lactobacillus ultunensis]